VAEEMTAILEDIRGQLAALAERVARLEAGEAPLPNGRGSESQTPLQSRDREGAVPGEISEEELLAVSAALGAYLGVRVHIRQIRLISSRAWAQEGRVSIQASHRLHP